MSIVLGSVSMYPQVMGFVENGGGHHDLSNAMFTAVTRNRQARTYPCAERSLFTEVQSGRSYPQIHSPYYYVY